MRLKAFTPKKIILTFFALALIVEVFVFNFRFWTSLGNEPHPIDLPYDAIADETSGLFNLNLSNKDLLIKNIGFYFEPVKESIPVGSVRTVQYTPALPAKINIKCAHENGEASVYEKTFAYNKDRICALTIDAKDAVSIEFSYDDAYLKQLSLNVRYDFSFSIYRFCIMFLFPCFIYLFRSGSSIWKIRLFDPDMRIKGKYIAIHVLLCAVIFGIVSFLLYSNPFFNDIPDLFGFYPDLARSFAGGHTYDAELPSRSLLELPDPYDPQALMDPNVDFKLDRLLYNGRYYTYFGPLPCVLFYLPYYLITGADMPHSVILLILLALFLTLTSLALVEAYKRYFPNGSIAGFYTGFFSTVFVTPFTLMASCDTFPYYIPILMAICLLIAGMYFYLKATNTIDNGRDGNVYLACGSAAIALIASCRPNLLIYALVFTPLLLPYATIKKENINRWVSFVSPVIIVAIPILLYNYARFGNPFDYGTAYGLTIDGRQQNPSVSSLLMAIWHYFLRPIYYTDHFPFVKFEITKWSNLDGTLVQAISGGVLILFPILLTSILSLLPCGNRTERTNTAKRMALILLFISLVSCIISSITGGYTTRYRMDFSTMLGISAVFMQWIILEKGEKTKNIFRNICCILLLISSFNSFTQLFGPDLVDHSLLTDTKSRYEQIFEFWR